MRKKIYIIAGFILIGTGLYFIVNNFLAVQAFEKGIYSYRRGIGFMSEYFGNYGRRDISTVQDSFKYSIKGFGKYVKVKNNDPNGYFMLGNSYYMLYKTGVMFMEKTGGNKKALSEDDLNKAIEAFNKAISYNPKYAEALYCLAMCYMNKDFITSYEDLNRAKECLSEISDGKRRAIWEKNINEALKGFPEMNSSESLNGSKVKFTNVSDRYPVYIAILTPGKTIPDLNVMDCLFNKDDTVTRDILPGKSYVICIGSKDYIISGIITAKTTTLYTFNIRPLENNFTIYDPKTMEPK